MPTWKTTSQLRFRHVNLHMNIQDKDMDTDTHIPTHTHTHPLTHPLTPTLTNTNTHTRSTNIQCDRQHEQEGDLSSRSHHASQKEVFGSCWGCCWVSVWVLLVFHAWHHLEDSLEAAKTSHTKRMLERKVVCNIPSWQIGSRHVRIDMDMLDLKLTCRIRIQLIDTESNVWVAQTYELWHNVHVSCDTEM